MVLDAGDAAVVEIVTAFETLKTLIWNGPLGAFEIAPFDTATVAAAQAAAKLTRDGALVTVAGGGDTVAALNHAGVADDFRRRVSGMDGGQGTARRGCAVLGVFPDQPAWCCTKDSLGPDCDRR